MKLHLTQAEGNNLITGFDAGMVAINDQVFRNSLIVQPNVLHTDWAVDSFDQLSEKDFEYIATLSPEVIILGTGNTHRFIHPKHTKALNAQNIPVECMTTNAACRTYNILMSEGRGVIAALIIDDKSN